jgi:hypothetical protein
MYRRYPTYVNVYRRGNKEASVSLQRLFQYCQLPDKFPVIFRRVFGIFRGTLTFLCILKFLVEPATMYAEHWP